MATHEQKVQLIKKYYKKIERYGDFFFDESLPKWRLNKAIEAFVPSDIDQTTIIGFYDISEKHNGTYGYLFTDDRIYYGNSGLSNVIVYADIEQVEFNGNNSRNHKLEPLFLTYLDSIKKGFEDFTTPDLQFKLYDGSTVYWNHFKGNAEAMYNFFIELIDLIHSDDVKEKSEESITHTSLTEEIDKENFQTYNERNLKTTQERNYTENQIEQSDERFTKKDTIKSTSLFKKLKFDINKVYPMIVVATVSSGKSTLINALVGKELLPSKGSACTARATAILDNDLSNQFRIHIVDSDGEYHLIEMASSQKVKDYNENNDVSEMIIEGDLLGIRNSEKSLLIIDTPGTNNSVNLIHRVITQNVLDEFTEGLILYVIDGHDPGTVQDDQLLKQIAEKVIENPDFHIIFAINKMDLVDPEQEDVMEYMNKSMEYIKEHGFEDPTLIPVSSKCALAFKKAINGETLSSFEKKNFASDFENFQRGGFSLVDYVFLSGQRERNEVVEINGKQYILAEIMAALENTGILTLEREIDKALVNRVRMSAPEVSYESDKGTERKELEAARVNITNTLNEILKKEDE